MTTSSHLQARWILKALEGLATWARMMLKQRRRGEVCMTSVKGVHRQVSTFECGSELHQASCQ